MKHAVKKRKFGRTRDQRAALMRSMALSLVRHGAIKTTAAKAKELRPYVEKLVSIARKDSVANRRLIAKRLQTTPRATALIFELSKKYTERPGGYTRIVKIGRRRTDGTPLAIIEFV